MAYPFIAEAFCKSNATQPSPAVVKRPFSVTSEVLCTPLSHA